MHCKQHFSVNWISAVIFLAIALVHSLRLATKTSLVIADFYVPNWVSLAAALLFAGLSYWNFHEARCCKSHEHKHDDAAL